MYPKTSNSAFVNFNLLASNKLKKPLDSDQTLFPEGQNGQFRLVQGQGHTLHAHVANTLSSSLAAGAAAGLTYPLSAAISKAIADQMRLPLRTDINLRGAPTTAARAMLQTGLVEWVMTPLSSLSETGCSAIGFGPDHGKFLSQVISLLATNLFVSIVTAPIETIALSQNKSGLSFLALGRDMVENNFKGLFASASSSFLSMNIAWSLRLYAREKSEGSVEKEKALSTKLSSLSVPVKNVLRCVNIRQMLHSESFFLASLGTLRSMLKQPINTIVLIGLNILIAAYLGNRIYFDTREALNKLLDKTDKHPSL